MKIPSASIKELRQFSLLLALFLISIVLYYLLFKGTLWYYLLAGSIGFAVIGWIYPKAIIVVYVPVMVISRVIGKLNAFALLTMLYLTVFTLYHFSFWISGFDPLQRKRKSSYWIIRENEFTDLTKQF